tara:strand:- start:1113 stop:1358 length:246 start_codon:yes stop_codon:yes gene_type:complete
MTKTYWLINSKRSEVRRFSKNINNKDQFFEYMFIDSGKIVDIFGKEPPLMTIRQEVKIEEAREIWKKLIAKGWRITEPVWN